jgi:hypothetical protein
MDIALLFKKTTINTKNVEEIAENCKHKLALHWSIEYANLRRWTSSFAQALERIRAFSEKRYCKQKKKPFSEFQYDRSFAFTSNMYT